MSGKVNSTGAVSGKIGTTVGTPSSAGSFKSLQVFATAGTPTWTKPSGNQPVGRGGASYWGGAGRGPHEGSNYAQVGTHGSGGPGGHSQSNETGADGGAGVVVVEEYS